MRFAPRALFRDCRAPIADTPDLYRTPPLQPAQSVFALGLVGYGLGYENLVRFSKR